MTVKGKKINVKVDGYPTNWTVTNILTRGNGNVKIKKSEKHGVYSTMILHLSPAKISGYNTCPKATEGCKKVCLNVSGHGQMLTNGELHSNRIHIARVGRTTLFHTNRKGWFEKVEKEINLFLKRCVKNDRLPAIRLNGTSDIAWEKVKNPVTGKTLIETFPMVQFYDYTKDFNRLNNVPENYFLNFSRTEKNERNTIKALKNGTNVAIIFEKALPETYKGYRVVNGDLTDLRFLDNKIFENKTGKGLVIGLKGKGCRIRHDQSGFLVRN